MIKFISILFLALIYWVLLFSMADAIAQFAICLDKATRRAVKKWRRNNG
jgi:hypothetical protein